VQTRIPPPPLTRDGARPAALPLEARLRLIFHALLTHKWWYGHTVPDNILPAHVWSMLQAAFGANSSNTSATITTVAPVEPSAAAVALQPKQVVHPPLVTAPSHGSQSDQIPDTPSHSHTETSAGGRSQNTTPVADDIRELRKRAASQPPAPPLVQVEEDATLSKKSHQLSISATSSRSLDGQQMHVATSPVGSDPLSSPTAPNPGPSASPLARALGTGASAFTPVSRKNSRGSHISRASSSGKMKESA
jgi:hypothetical protein